MKPILALIAALVAGTLAGCDAGPQSPPKTEAVKALSQPSHSTPPEDEIGSGPSSTAGGASDQSPVEPRRALEATRNLMSKTMDYMNQGKFDLAEKNVQVLKAQRDTLPEYLQVQVDRLDSLLKTGSTNEPQRSLKAAIIESRERDR